MAGLLPIRYVGPGRRQYEIGIVVGLAVALTSRFGLHFDDDRMLTVAVESVGALWVLWDGGLRIISKRKMGRWAGGSMQLVPLVAYGMTALFMCVIHRPWGWVGIFVLWRFIGGLIVGGMQAKVFSKQ